MVYESFVPRKGDVNGNQVRLPELVVVFLVSLVGLSPSWLCEEYISSYRKSQQKCLRELYNIYKNFIMTNEDINRDTKYTINNDTNNHNRAQSARVEHSSAPLVVFPVLMLSHDPLGSSRFTCLSSSRHVAHVWFSLIFTYLPFYFDLSFPVFFHSSVLMHPDLHTDLDNLDSVENNLRQLRQGEQRRLRRHLLPHRLPVSLGDVAPNPRILVFEFV